jgi:hypothetical protein
VARAQASGIPALSFPPANLTGRLAEQQLRRGGGHSPQAGAAGLRVLPGSESSLRLCLGLGSSGSATQATDSDVPVAAADHR